MLSSALVCANAEKLQPVKNSSARSNMIEPLAAEMGGKPDKERREQPKCRTVRRNASEL
jgi:hypothetical protein